MTDPLDDLIAANASGWDRHSIAGLVLLALAFSMFAVPALVVAVSVMVGS